MSGPHQLRLRFMETPFNPVPDVLIETDCREPLNETDIEPDSPPLMARLMLPLDARPETPPDALKLLSSQLPVMRPLL